MDRGLESDLDITFVAHFDAFIWASVALRGMACWLLGHLLSGFSGSWDGKSIE